MSCGWGFCSGRAVPQCGAWHQQPEDPAPTDNITEVAANRGGEGALAGEHDGQRARHVLGRDKAHERRHCEGSKATHGDAEQGAADHQHREVGCLA